MLVTSKEMLEKARREHYAVPAMNTQGGNYDIIWAICRAAEEMHFDDRTGGRHGENHRYGA